MIEEASIGVDVGGTFTDVVLLTPEGILVPRKILSSPPEYQVAIRDGVEQTLAETGIGPGNLGSFMHGATVATNAILTRSGARTGLITTQGFRDVLEIRRMRMHRLYDITWEKPEPLVPRHLRVEVPARADPWGNVVVPLDEAAVRQGVERLVAEDVESIAVCYLHAYADGTAERRTREIIQEMAPGCAVSLSSEVLPEIKEYERTSTTVINAYVQPVVDRYARAMEEDLDAMGIDVPVMVMQSSGGVMPLALARELPIHIIESGPAAGVTGAFHLARRMGLDDALTLDMGGTTAKAGIIEEGAISRSPEYEVGGEISIGHRMMKGSGYLLRVPSIDLAEVSAGGGSIAWADPGGALKVGPRSAGAAPGPACYDQGGGEPTITDANVHLGLTNPQALAGGALAISPEKADQAIRDRIAGPLGIDTTQAAWGIRAVANASLIRAIRAVSTERGRDPQQFALFAFGGMGPAQALDVAAELGIKRVIVPPLPGLFSALGLLFAEVQHHLVRTHYADTETPDCERMNEAHAALAKEAAITLEREGFAADRRTLTLSADLRYRGQDHSLTVPLREARLDPKAVAGLVEDFHRLHERTYGYRSDNEPVQVVALRCLGRGLTDGERVPEHLVIAAVKGWRPSPARRCYFGPGPGWIETDIVGRGALGERPVAGPLIVEEDNALTVVPPNWKAHLDGWSNIVLEPT
jgi:N-methylhydantoinase A